MVEVILKQDIYKLGDKDDIVKVKNGYALNYLIPKGYAILATPSAKKVLAENIKQAEHRQAKIKGKAIETAELLKNITIRIETLAGKDGKLFGSVTSLQVHNFLKENGFDVDRRRISVPRDIRTLGTYFVTVTLHKEVKVEVPLEIVAKQQ
jgi:large subunit ribosomal protein L9